MRIQLLQYFIFIYIFASSPRSFCNSDRDIIISVVK